MSFVERLEEVRTGFARPFWVANISEIFERLAYYGAFASLANYLRETLSFPTEQTGTLTGIFGGYEYVCCWASFCWPLRYAAAAPRGKEL